ncbi:hypothetical protein KGQ19_36740 [Catenulispora sp. NL8]|uniref:Glycosyltransferase 2-like domain-containing protein n=1 Tax=Catenulispora pinistramenti TaxID=2705254 RepID=A0ABS5L273_9ACTN|nr:hypothetical protein [Catenulispora pinistramenti]MBS2552418.1 hypothetical protein [Catenulispora pinistramenti]
MILPFGFCPEQPERQQNLAHVLQGLREDLAYPNYRIVVTELGLEATQRLMAKEFGAEYIFAAESGEFSPGRAMNVGFLGRDSAADLVYFHQADFLVAPDVLGEGVGKLTDLGCPFVYPYWGEIHLSRPVSGAVRSGLIPATALVEVFKAAVGRWRMRDEPAARQEDLSHSEIIPDELDIAETAAWLPADLSRALIESGYEELWGLDDREYAPYSWRPGISAASRLCRVSAGPRASAAYLCTDAAFRRVGGIPELPGWGYEDLMFWRTVQAFHPYESDRRGISLQGEPITLGYPLLHLWHPVGGRPAYYEATRRNEERYLEFAALDSAGRRARVRPLPPSAAVPTV